MGPRVARRIRTLASIVAVGVVPAIAFCQAERPPDRAEQILDAIAAAQAAEGPRSPDLIQLLAELGTLYEADGEHALATAALQEARSVVRANYGLHTLEQLPLLQQALANQRALGNLPMVQALEEELLELADRHPDDLRTVTIYRDAGERRLDVLRRFLAGEAPSEIYPEIGFWSFYKDDVIADLVSDAQTHLAVAAAVLLRNGLYSSDELRELEAEIVRASEVVGERERDKSKIRPVPVEESGFVYRAYDPGEVFDPELVQRTNTLSALANGGGLQDAPAALQEAVTAVPEGAGLITFYEIGRESLKRVIAYDDIAYGSSVDEATLRSRLEAYLRLADWELLYGQNREALEQYARVRELLATSDFAARLIAVVFSPPIPTVLPAFMPNPLSTEPSARYIEASFEVTKYGESRNVEIVGATPGVSAAAKHELADLIKGSRYRPRVADGELGRAAPVVVRYYLSD
jgi:hypothetical protein